MMGRCDLPVATAWLDPRFGSAMTPRAEPEGAARPRRRAISRLVTAVIAAALLMTACANSEEDASTSGTDADGNVYGPDSVSFAGDWTVTDLQRDDEQIPAPASANTSFRFADGRIAGTAGCNQMSGPLALADDGSAVVGILALTRKLCPDSELMMFESSLAEAIGAVDRWQRDADLLVLTGPDVGIIFVAES